MGYVPVTHFCALARRDFFPLRRLFAFRRLRTFRRLRLGLRLSRSRCNLLCIKVIKDSREFPTAFSKLSDRNFDLRLLRHSHVTFHPLGSSAISPFKKSSKV